MRPLGLRVPRDPARAPCQSVGLLTAYLSGIGQNRAFVQPQKNTKSLPEFVFLQFPTA